VEVGATRPRILRRRTIAGAGIDVYVGEPPVTYDPDPNPGFLGLDNVILTPHLGGCTEDALSGIASLGAQSLVARFAVSAWKGS
jgi:phosphoglycerate dehydrogenase-like enzyme